MGHLVPSGANKMHKIVILNITLGILTCMLYPAFAQEDATLSLAVQLAEDGDHDGAAIEFRRLALESTDRSEQGSYYWAAAYEYLLDEKHQWVADLLDRAEDAYPDRSSEIMLLRSSSAEQEERWDEAQFYLESVSRSGSSEAKQLAARHLAAVLIWDGDPESARELLSQLPGENDLATAAIDSYMEGVDKKPKVGGLLGLLPGAGYAYAGEYANALRSLILNSLFIFGMVETAEDDEWGAFAAITFFEFTWYSGSIYGGIDASYRYNRRRIEDVVDVVNGNSTFQPDYKQLPKLSLEFRF